MGALEERGHPVERLVGGGVVRLPGVAEETGGGGEEHEVAQLAGRDAAQEVVQPDYLGLVDAGEVLGGLALDQAVRESAGAVDKAGDTPTGGHDGGAQAL